MQIGSTEWSDLMIEGAAALNIDLTRAHTRQFAIHADELIRWNQKVNITAITAPQQIAVKHFVDSLVAARFLPADAAVLDIGSGGGFPGLPLKILIPSLTVTLIDASRKRVNFLRHVIRSLKLKNAKARHIRAEDLAGAGIDANRFDVIISRAFSSLDHFFKLALPLLAKDGVMIALKGNVDQHELRDLQGRAMDDGDDNQTIGRHFSVTVEKFHLPFLNAKRSLIMIRKMK